MSNQQLVCDQSICARKERRYKTSEEGLLRCETALQEGGSRQGSVVDLSTSGLRMLCDGRFEVGQPICTELTTGRSHGIYRGIVRRVEPWVSGQSILGCSLSDSIPDSVLQDLANDGVVNRRSDCRIMLSHRAMVSWPLHQSEVEVDIHDFSIGGMKMISADAIPEDVRLRIRIEVDSEEEELVVEARTAWQREFKHGHVTGVAFTHRDEPTEVARVLGLEDDPMDVPAPAGPSRMRQGLAFAACTAIICYVALTAF